MKTRFRCAAALLLSLATLPSAADETIRAEVLPPVTLAGAAPPPVVTLFESASSNRVFPADPHGAVGPSHFVGAFNSGIVVHDRNGKPGAQLTLAQFWGGSSFFYHPRVAYDAAADRWVITSVDDGKALMLGVSRTGDPVGQWARYRIVFETGGDIDLARLALTRDSVVMVADRLEWSSCVMIVAQKADLYEGDDDLDLDIDDAGGSSYMVVPVSAPDSDVEYLLHALDPRSIGLKRFDEFQWNNIAAPADWEPGWFFGKQRDTSNDLDFGFDQIQNAVLHNGMIWAVHMAGAMSGPDRTIVLWWKIDPVRETVVAHGKIDDGAAYYGFPSIAVSNRGALIAYSVMSKAQYPSSRYVFIDPAGNVSSEGTIKDGTSSIRNSDLWGNYTATVVDPVSPSMFWTLQMFASGGTWATAWAGVKAPASTVRRRSVR